MNLIHDPETDAILTLLNRAAQHRFFAEMRERICGPLSRATLAAAMAVGYECSDADILAGVIYVG